MEKKLKYFTSNAKFSKYFQANKAFQFEPNVKAIQATLICIECKPVIYYCSLFTLCKAVR